VPGLQQVKVVVMRIHRSDYWLSRFLKFAAVGQITFLIGVGVLVVEEETGMGHDQAFLVQPYLLLGLTYVANQFVVWWRRKMRKTQLVLVVAKWLLTQLLLPLPATALFGELRQSMWLPLAYVLTKGLFGVINYTICEVWVFQPGILQWRLKAKA